MSLHVGGVCRALQPAQRHTILDAMRPGQPLKELGLEAMVVPRDGLLYIISHSGETGLIRGEATRVRSRCLMNRNTNWPFPSR